MTPRGGARPGAGRKAGKPGKRKPPEARRRKLAHTLTLENLEWLDAEASRRTQPGAVVSKSDLINEALERLRAGGTATEERADLAELRELEAALLDALVKPSSHSRTETLGRAAVGWLNKYRPDRQTRTS